MASFFFRVLLKSKGVKYADSAYLFYRKDVHTSITKTNNPEKAKDILKTYISYENILKIKNTYAIRKALAFNYAKFIYIHCKKEEELINIAWQRMKQLNVNEKWKVGGNKFQLLCRLIGFKNALKLKN